MSRNYNLGKRGRPSVAETYYQFPGYEIMLKQCYGGQLANNPFSKRTHTNRVYAAIGKEVLEPYTTQYPELENILPARIIGGRVISKSGILEQIGRMKHQNQFSDQDILYTALMAVDAKDRGIPSKRIEQAIRKIRIAGSIDPDKW